LVQVDVPIVTEGIFLKFTVTVYLLPAASGPAKVTFFVYGVPTVMEKTSVSVAALPV
jgi:hypothetical protein